MKYFPVVPGSNVVWIKPIETTARTTAGWLSVFRTIYPKASTVNLLVLIQKNVLILSDDGSVAMEFKKCSS